MGDSGAMKMLSILRLSIVSLICAGAFVAAGCVGTNEIAGPVIYDTLYYSDTGFVYDPYYDRVIILQDCDTMKDLAGVRVSVMGLNQFTFTDSSGRFKLERIPAYMSVYVQFSRSDIYTQIDRVSGNDSTVAVLHHLHEYSARLDGDVTLKPRTQIRSRDTLIYETGGERHVETIRDTIKGYDISIPITGVDDGGYANSSTILYLIIARTPVIDPLDKGTFVTIKEGSGGGGVGITTFELAELGINSGDEIYYAATSRPVCFGARFNPTFITPGTKISQIRKLIVP
jgi:hypothetical protein